MPRYATPAGTLIIGLIGGLAIGLGASASAQSGTRPRVAGPPCWAWPPSGYSCDLPKPTGAPYGIVIKSLDLSCQLTAANKYAAETFACDRLSSTPFKCNVDGVFQSLGVYINTRTVEVDGPARCVSTSGAPGYRLTSNPSAKYSRTP